MPAHALSLAAVLSVFAGSVLAQEPLTDRIYPYNQVPYQVDTDATGRGPQAGFTQCNSTTETQSSMCQLAMINALDDFCLWGPPDPNSLIGDEEAETVAWCTKPGHGTRIMPEGTITGVQFLKAPSYVLVAGNINQANINIAADDGGGEMDPHGADERGNPLGGLVYSSAFPSNNGNNNSYQQVIEWHNFMGSSQFCFKICDPAVAGSKVYCNNIFDMTGCNFVSPASYQDGVFEVCDSDNMDPVGVFTGSDGKTSVYSQPAVVTSLPSVRTPSSSNCQTFTSSALYAAAATISGASPSGSSTGTASSPTGTGTSSGTIKTTTKAGSSGAPSGTNSASPSSTSGAANVRAEIVGGLGGFVGVAGLVVAGMVGVVAGL